MLNIDKKTKRQIKNSQKKLRENTEAIFLVLETRVNNENWYTKIIFFTKLLNTR